MIKSFYKIHDFSFSLSTNCDNARVHLEALFPALHAEHTECIAEWHCQRVAEYVGTPLYTVCENDSTTMQSETLCKSLDHIEWSITKKILQTHRHLLQVHAAALAYEEKALVIVGPSGAGKSSLALSLLLQGWKLLSDEIVFIDPSSYRIFSFPRNLHISSETLMHFPELDTGNNMSTCTDASGKSRINTALFRGTGTTLSAHPWCLVFPDHRPDYVTALTPLGKTASLALLTVQTINLGEFGMRGLEALSHFIDTCDSYILTSRDFISASSVLSRFVKNSRQNIKPTGKYDNLSDKINRINNVARPTGVC